MESSTALALPSPLMFQKFINVQSLSNQRRKNLSYLGQLFVNGRYYHVYKKTTCNTTYWSLDKLHSTSPAYFFPTDPHIVSDDPHKLWHEFDRLEKFFAEQPEHLVQVYSSDDAVVEKHLKQSNALHKIGALTIHDGAYPRGGFANQTEYDRYIQLFINNRMHEIPAYLATLAGGPAFNARDPYPHGYCYLLLLPTEHHALHFREGQDFLTKQILERIWPQIDRNRIICYELRVADAHISLEKRPPANSILIKAGDLADKLRDAFLDGVADHTELEDIYFSTTFTNRS